MRYITLLAVLYAASLQAQTYSYSYYQVPNAIFSDATDLTADGNVVGYFTPDLMGYYGFVEVNGGYTTFSLPATGAPNTVVAAAHGGKLLGVRNVTEGFLLEPGPKVTLLQFPGADFTEPASLNTQGVIVGHYANTSQGIVEAGFVLERGEYQTFSVPGSYVTSFGDINDSGVIAGTYSMTPDGPSIGFRWDHGTVNKIQFPGGLSTSPSGINNSGEIVGSYVTPDGSVSCFRFDGATYTDFHPPDAFSCLAYHIKDSGQVVGTFTDTSFVTQGFVGSPVN